MTAEYYKKLWDKKIFNMRVENETTEILGLNNEDIKEYIELLGNVTRSFMQGKKAMKQNSFTIKADKDSSNISEDWQWHNEGDEQQNKKGLTEQSKPYGIGANRPHTEQQSEKDSSGVSPNQVLYKTDDGKNVCKNDAWMVYKVTPDFDILMFAACDAGFHSDSKYFAKEELAKEYVVMNKPCLSLNEIERIMSMNIVKGCTHKNERHIHGTATINSLKQVIQQKLNKNL